MSNRLNRPAAIRFGSLRLSLPFGLVLPVALLIAMLMAGAAELVMRSPSVQSRLVLPQLSGHDELGPKVYAADRLVTDEGPINCVFIGNSITAKAIDPDTFSQAYQAETGKPLRCFNFALNGLNMDGDTRLAEIFAARFHPQIIILGVHYKGFGSTGTTTTRLDIPWVNYQLGAPQFQGWLEASSTAYRTYLTYSQDDLLKSSTNLTEHMTRYGYVPDPRIADSSRPLDPVGDKAELKNIKNFNLRAGRPKFDQFLSRIGTRAEVVVVELPIPPQTMLAFQSMHSYQDYVDTLAAETAAHQVAFIKTMPPDQVPATAYRDRTHMNVYGAVAFSTWLGRQVGQMALKGAFGSLGN